MRSDDAKKLPLDQILGQLGFSPAKSTKNGRELWYTSPFREEKEPSFHISLVPHSRLGSIWVWKDFGDRGGNVVDFALRYYRLAASDVSGALARLEELGGGRAEKAPSPVPQLAASVPQAETPAHPFTDVIIGPLEHPELLEYLAGRGIEAELARKYVQQVSYMFNGVSYLALAFKTDLGGYEMRSTGRFKGSLPPKTITTLHAEKLADCREVTVFEGWTDYLSALAFYGKTEAATPVIILNSVAMEKAAIEKIRSMEVSKVHLYLDRDTSGQQLTGLFRQEFPEVEIVDHSNLYAEYKDFNLFWVARKETRVR